MIFLNRIFLQPQETVHVFLESHSLKQTTQNSVYHEGLNDATLYTLICPKTIPRQFVYKIKGLQPTV